MGTLCWASGRFCMHTKLAPTRSKTQQLSLLRWRCALQWSSPVLPLGFILDLHDSPLGGTLVAYVMRAQLGMNGVKNTPHPAQEPMVLSCVQSPGTSAPQQSGEKSLEARFLTHLNAVVSHHSQNLSA